LHRARLSLEQAGDRLRVYAGKDSNGRVHHRTKVYPLKYTLKLLQDMSASDIVIPPGVEKDQLVSFDRVVEELGWARNTARHYLAQARRLIHTVPDPKDNRKNLYPLRHTAKALRRQHNKAQARRRQMKDEGAGYWVALANLKAASSRLKQLSIEASALSMEVRSAFEGLRRKPPITVDIYTLPDPGLALIQPLSVLVAPLRRTYWRAAIPEIPLRGVGTTPENAVADLRKNLAEKYHEIHADGSCASELWKPLCDMISGGAV
jgi:hypothetical protein